MEYSNNEPDSGINEIDSAISALKKGDQLVGFEERELASKRYDEAISTLKEVQNEQYGQARQVADVLLPHAMARSELLEKEESISHAKDIEEIVEEIGIRESLETGRWNPEDGSQDNTAIEEVHKQIRKADQLRKYDEYEKAIDYYKIAKGTINKEVHDEKAEELLSEIEKGIERAKEDKKQADEQHRVTDSDSNGEGVSVTSQSAVIEKLQNIGEYEFEHFVADVWEQQGWMTKVTKGSNDGGVDIIAQKKTPFDQKHIIQAKRYSDGNNVGGPEIQQYSSLRQQIKGSDAVVVVTTSEFTTQAREVAENLNVKLINKDDLFNLIKNVDTNELLNKYFEHNDAQQSTGQNQNSETNRSSGWMDIQSIDSLESEFIQFISTINLKEVQWIDVYFVYNNSVDSYYQLIPYANHNLTGLQGEQFDQARSLAERYQLSITEIDENSGYIIFSSPRKESEGPKITAQIAAEILHEIYSVEPCLVRNFEAIKNK